MINIVTSSRYKINRQKIKLFVENIFEKEQFDMIFSSSFLEHLKDSKKFLKNSKVFLNKSGYSVHIVPSRFMKIS